MPGIKCSDMSSIEELMHHQLDLADPLVVQVLYNESTRTIHVNVNGTCALRASRVRNMVIEIDRKEGSTIELRGNDA